MQTNLPFSMEEYRTRLAKYRKELAARGVGSAVVTLPENIYYLTGFHAQSFFRGKFFGLVVTQQEEPILIVRILEEPLVRALTWIERCESIRDTDDTFEVIERALKAAGAANRIGLEHEHLSHGFMRRLAERIPGVEFPDISGTVEKLRLVKSDAEVEYIRRAARVAEAGLAAGVGAVKPGARETELAAAVYGGMLGAGGDYPGIHPFVLSDERTAYVHLTWDHDRRVAASKPVHFEIGGCVKRYGGVIMRTVVSGPPPTVLRERSEALAKGLEAAIGSIRPGVTAGEVDAACRSVIEEAGWGHLFFHRLGYSLGVGFPPGWGEGYFFELRPDFEAPLQENMVFHLVPFLLEDGVMGTGMSETVRVTSDGCEVITNYPRELLEV